MTSAALKTEHGPSQTDMAIQLLSITNDMTAVLTDESDDLSTARPKDFKDLGKRKTELFSAYASAMSAVQALGQSKLNIDEALKAALRDATLQFKKALERNQSLLKAQLDLSQGVMTSIGKEVERQQNPVRTYANPGATQRKIAPTSIALNQTI